MHTFIYVLLLLGLNNALDLNLEEGEPCITPNGENAICTSINSCKVIKETIAYLDPEAIEFAKKSQCGYNNSPLVCCGSTGKITTVTPQSTTQQSHVEFSTIHSPIPSPKPIDNIHLPDHSLCGIQIKQNRIVGGTITEIDEFPWVVALKYTLDDGGDGGFRCGGTLITQRYVLTAAQCVNVRGFKLTGVRLGEWRLSTERDCGRDTENTVVCADPPLDVGIEAVKPHPYYSKRSGNNDIAVLKLDRKVKYTDYVRPICLPPVDFPPPPIGTLMHISGWGVTENGTQSDVKLKAIVPMVSNNICEKVYPNRTTVNSNQACAGGEEGRDACSGDAGGPLMTTYKKEDNTEEEQWFQEGIIYKGIGCGRKGIPGLYTRLSRYVNWILNQIDD